MTQNVNVTYRLSITGQKAALLSGRCASQIVTETMILDDPTLLDRLTITSGGLLELDLSTYQSLETGHGFLVYFDTPPSGIADLIAGWDLRLAQAREENRQNEEKRLAKVAEEKRREDDRLAKDAPEVTALLAEIAALDPLAPLPQDVMLDGYWGTIVRGAYHYAMTAEQSAEVKTLAGKRTAATETASAAAEAAKHDALQAMLSEHGGYLWQLQAGMCDFKGFNLWSSRQTRRWVGIFTSPKGIASFLDSPRGEYTFDVSGLNRGDCIQGGGYDTNSKGKRRYESEFFGVVVRNDDVGLVVHICESRTGAMAKAEKLLQSQERESSTGID